MNIYEKIFDRLTELHMSQIELSRRTGIATSTISDWRKKKINPQADKLVAICKALDMSLVDLLCNGDEKEEKVVQTDYMLDERICKLRQKLNDSILKEQDYNVTYKLSVELDELIVQYYRRNLKGINRKINMRRGKIKNL